MTITAGVAQQNVTLTLGGFALLVVGLTAIVVHMLDHAIRDTTEERRRLQDSLAEERRRLQEAQEEVQADRLKYLAARAHVDHEAERLCRLGIQMELDTTARLVAEREELMAELEDRTASLKNEGFQLGLVYNDRGLIGDALYPRPDAKVIQLPVGTVGSTAGRGAYSPS
jgi:hypothetical protein